MFSTAEDGAVILDTDGKSVTVTGWTGRRVELKPRRRARASARATAGLSQ
jgi:hypothetical protein